MKIRFASVSDLEEISAIELLTFPPAEAALPETFSYRLKHFPEYFYVAEEDGHIEAFLSGRPVEGSEINDSMYENVSLPEGNTFALLSVNTIPNLQGRGIASALINHSIRAAKSMSCRKIALACKEEKLKFYQKFGFQSSGLSKSTHGGAVWYDMYLNL